MTQAKYMPRTFEGKLGHFIEECGEAMAAAGKTLRFGLDAYNPEDDERETNRAWLIREVRDVQ